MKLSASVGGKYKEQNQRFLFLAHNINNTIIHFFIHSVLSESITQHHFGEKKINVKRQLATNSELSKNNNNSNDQWIAL